MYIYIYYIYTYIYIYMYIYVYMNTKLTKVRNVTNFDQKVKLLKTLNFRYDTET